MTIWASRFPVILIVMKNKDKTLQRVNYVGLPVDAPDGKLLGDVVDDVTGETTAQIT